jgi:hypothetical protein
MGRMSSIVELFGTPTANKSTVWNKIVQAQHCPFLDKMCVKVRKSEPDVAIGTCTVVYGKKNNHIIICPHRLIERGQIFMDCLHLLTNHQPGNELHVIPEVSIPGGSVDYFIASVRSGKVLDFVGVELQTLDTTGTVWPERQKFLNSVKVACVAGKSDKSLGMNWKMSAKTILVQLHHKIETFDAINKHLVLVIQDVLLDYLKNEFNFKHFVPARLGDSMHIHAYSLVANDGKLQRLDLRSRLSTDASGIAKCLNLKADAKVGYMEIVKQLEAKISKKTLFTIAASKTP